MLTIGRVRGLAAALGIGAALTVGAGVAWAEGDGTAADHAAADSAPASSDTGTGRTAAAATADHVSDTTHEAEATAADETPARHTAQADTENTADDPPNNSADPADEAADLTEQSAARHSHAVAEEATVAVAKISGPADEPSSSKSDDTPSAPADEPVAALAYAAAERREKSVTAPAQRVVATEMTETTDTSEPVVAASVASASAAAVTAAGRPPTAMDLIEQFIYRPVHYLVQAWIQSDIGSAVDGIVNALLGSYVIGNGADGTEDHPDGGAGGWLLGDGGKGWNSTLAGSAGGKGGAAGAFGTGGIGGTGGAGAAGGAGGAGGWLMGVGGGGGDGGAGAAGGPGGSGGAGGDAVGLFLGVGGHGGRGGDGSDGGRGGTGGDGALVLGTGGAGGDAGDSGIGGAATQLPPLGGAGGTAGWLGAHGVVGASGTGGVIPGTGESAPALLTVSANGTWLTTADGRVVVLHGANEVYKVGSFDPADSGFGADDAEFLAANGFNVVRLGIIWAAVEPQPGVFDAAYLASIAQTVQTLSDYGIYTVLDMHQDNYGGTFGGEGAPDWAAQTGGLPNNDFGFPWSYILNPAEGHAWDSFWANAETPTGLGLTDEYARAWENVASYFTGNSAVIGYDIMNEPFEGSNWLSALLGSTFFVEQQLTPMYNQVIAAIRAVDPITAIFAEPTAAIFELGTLLGRPLVMGRIDDANVVMAVHNYCYGSATTGICGWIAATVADSVHAYSVQHQIPVFMGEFGASDVTSDLIAAMDAADRYFTSWTVWAYSGNGDITTAGTTTGEALVYDPAASPSGNNVNTSNLLTLSAPHPQLISGTPNSWSFSGGTLNFSYSTEKVDGSGSFAAGSQTTIAVPAIQFPNGYQVSVTGGRVVSAAGASVLVIASDLGATTVSVVVSANAPIQV